MPLAFQDYRGDRPSVVALGTFDGVHLGHQALLRAARARAQAHQALSLAFTFPQPPGNHLGYPKPLLLPPALKFRLLERWVARVVVCEFPQIAGMAPEPFVREVLCRQLRAQDVVVGQDYRFGKGRSGDVALLQALGQRYGFEVHPLAPVELDGEPVSSTRIRRAIRAGEIPLARRLLGRPPLLWGRVVRGAGRGRTLGFPTANLAPGPEFVHPDQGIFAGWACLEGRAHPAAVYIGEQPTFTDGQRTIEVHLLERGAPELYRAQLHVYLVEKLRDDARFESVEALQDQVRHDLARARRALAELPLERGDPLLCPEPERADRP